VAPVKKKDPLSAVRIVRGTETTSYEVQPDNRPLLPKSAPTNLLSPENWDKSGTGSAAPSEPINIQPAPQAVPGLPLQLLAPDQKAAVVSN
jgi:hypothetical protein